MLLKNGGKYIPVEMVDFYKVNIRSKHICQKDARVDFEILEESMSTLERHKKVRNNKKLMEIVM